MKKRNSLSLQIILFLVISLTILFISGIKPHYNWDMLGYTGIMYLWDGESQEEIHGKTYRLIKESVPGDSFDSLTTKYDYLINNYRDFKTFGAQMPFYLIRPLYNAINYGAFKAGIPFVAFTYFSGILCYFIMFVILLIWLNDYLMPLPAFLTALIAFLAALYIKVMFYTTPDALTLLLAFIGLYYIIRKKRMLPGYIFLFLAQLTRSDSIIYSIIAILTIIIFRFDNGKYSAAKGAIFILISILSFFIVNYFSGAYSYSVTFYHTLTANLDRPDLSGYTLTLGDYLAKLSANLSEFRDQRMFAIFIPVIISLVFAKLLKAGVRKDIVIWNFAILAMTLAHFMLLPVLWQRFFMHFYYIAIVLWTAVLNDIFHKYQRDSRLFQFIFQKKLSH